MESGVPEVMERQNAEAPVTAHRYIVPELPQEERDEPGCIYGSGSAGTVLLLHLYHTSRPKPVLSAAPRALYPYRPCIPILCTMWLEDNIPWGARDSPSLH